MGVNTAMIVNRAWALALAFSAIASAQPKVEFEAASIRRATTSFPRRTEFDDVRFSAPASTLRSLITQAYGIDDYQLVGNSGWTNTEFWTVSAAMRPTRDRAQVMEMLRNLLADEFHLKAHLEIRRVKALELQLEKGGPKLLSESTPPQQPPNISPGRLTLSVAATLPELARYLSTRTGPDAPGWPVVDRTDLHGRYAIWLTFANQIDPDGRSGTLSIDYMTELPRQLGLRLSPTQADISFLVIDNAVRPDAP